MTDSGDTEVTVPKPVSQPLIPPFLPHAIRRLAVPILLGWLGIMLVTNLAVPQLEEVG
jgi:RND superfamily putative drug exporter